MKNQSFKVGKNEMGQSMSKGSAQTETLTDISRMYRKAINQFNKYGYADGGGVSDEKYYVIDAKNGKIMSIAFDTEEEAKSEKYKLFEKSGNHFLTQKLIANNSAHFLNNMVADKMKKIKTMSGFADMVRNFSEPVTKKDLENMLPDYVSGKDITKVLSHTDSLESNLEVINKGGDRYDMGVNWEVRENGKVIAEGNIVGDYPVVFKGKKYEGLYDLSESINAKLVEIEDEDDDYKHGGIMVANELSNRLPATTSAIDRQMAERIYSERPSRFEDRGLKYAIGGMIGNEIQFDHYGENKNGTITEAMSNGNFAVSSGFGSYLVEPHEVISISNRTEKMKKGFFFAQGGSTNSGLSWHQDRARHNKSENYEVPMSDRKKFEDGGSIEQQNYAMIQSDNKAIMHHLKELNSVLKTNKTVPAWALALVNQSSQNLSNVTHYLDGAKKFETGGISPQIYGQDVTFLDINGNEQIGMVQDMDNNGAEVFYEERFIKIPAHRIVKFDTGGSVNSGLSWYQDRARHNKSENYERPLSERKQYS